MRGVTMFVSENTAPTPLNIVADPTAIHATLPTLVQVIASIRNDGVQGVDFVFELAAGMEIVEEAHKITARLYDSEIELRPEGWLLFRKVRFSTGYLHHFAGAKSRRGSAYVKITPTSAEFNPEDAAALLKLLLASKVIYQERSVFPYLD